jgi:hypothetical protein
LKTNTLKLKKKSVIHNACFLVFFVLASTATRAQVQNNGSLFIGDGGTVYVGSGDYTFGSGGATETTRTASYGKLIYESGATTSGAANAHFLNGYGSMRSTIAFTFPVGQSGVYAPVKVTPSTTAAVDAAYLRASAAGFDPDLDPTVTAVSTVEYWNIKGTNSAAITLTWRADSNLAAIGVANSTANLTIVGYRAGKWEKIPSTVDVTSILGGASSITTGSISSTGTIALSSYEYFSLGAEEIICAPIVAASGNTSTWNGTAWDVTPTLADVAIVASNTPNSPGSFACNSLVLGADITLTNGQNVEVVNGVTGIGKIVMASEASVVQREKTATAPSIVLTKTSRAMRQYDYIYWGTPIAGNFLSQLSTAVAPASGLTNPFDSKIKYVSLPVANGGGWQILDAISTGKGFATRIKNQAPFLDQATTGLVNFTFTGVANNGDIPVGITRDPAFPNGGRSHNLLANPYPSAIDADKLITDNLDIDGVVYLWSAATANVGIGQAYTQADYMVYTLAGTVVPNTINKPFDGKIASGQGFLVKSLVNSGTVTFNNCMRLTTNNNQFQKVKNTKTVAADSYKLNMTGENGVFSQILVSYLPNATLGYDRMYDAGRNSLSTAQLFSIFEGDGRRLAINARPSFVADDIVPIGVSKTSTYPETFTIALTEKTGIFTTAEQSVYIHDAVTNTYFDLNNGDFTFTTDKNVLDRYKIAYTAGTLSNPKFENNGVFASLNKNVIALQSSVPLTGIEVYDLTGRRILESKINNTLSSTTAFVFPKAVYIVKAKLNNGTVASFKLINN